MEPDALGVLGSIKSAGEMQLVLVNDILDASKIDSGKFTIEEGAYDLKKMLKRVEDLFLFKTKEAGLGFTLHQQQEETHQLIGDGQRIGQILTNLVSNAIKFTASGDVILRSRREGERLIFEVEDSGIGMSAEGSAKLFNRFEQADGSISKRFGGSGLGLYISLNLAELMGGSIEVLSEEGVGSTFTVVLPYQQSDKLVEKGETDHTALQTHQTLKGTVLIAEDVALLQQLVRRMLEKIGVSVTLVENGKEAVEQVQQHTFDLVLMDMQMPIMESYGRKWCSGS
jgi:K+-sensing histidine kinase KdpD